MALSVEMTTPSPICVICLDTLDTAPQIQTVCHHFFHEECLNTHLEQRDHCPLCKTVFILDEDLPHLPTERISRLFRQIFSGSHSTEQLQRLFVGIHQRPSFFEREDLITQGLDDAIDLSPIHIPLFFQNLGSPNPTTTVKDNLLQALKNAFVQRKTQSIAYLFLEAARIRSIDHAFFVRDLRTTFPEREIHIYIRREVIPAIRALPHAPYTQRALAMTYSIPQAVPFSSI